MSESARQTLLLVEDEAILAMNEKMQLERYGYAVKTVTNGEKAVEAVNTMPGIDLVLMDINLGDGIDGTEAAEIILRDYDIPIVFVSSHSEREIVEKTEKITSYGYVVKNSSITVLDASIKMAFKLFDAKKREQKKEHDLRESEKRIQKKLYALTAFDANISELELEDIIDVDAVQSLMDAFYKFTSLPVAIIDLAGKVLVQTGWQDICTKFHRMHPETLKNCIECDTILTRNVPAGEFKSYLCKNSLWDNVTPIMIGGSHVGNLLTGQFFYEGEKPDDSVFLAQAKQYCFNEKEYMDAVRRVPIWKREVAKNGLSFYAKLANTISALSHSNLSLVKALAEQKQVSDTLRLRESRWSALVDTIPDFISILDNENRFLFLNHYAEGFSEKDVLGKSVFEFLSPESCAVFKEKILNCRETLSAQRFEHAGMGKYGVMRDYEDYLLPSSDTDGSLNIIVVSRDITERKDSEEALRASEERFNLAIECTDAGIWDWDMLNDKVVFSRRWKSMLGFEDHEVENAFSGWKNLWHPDDKVHIEKTLDDYLSGKSSKYEVIHRCRHKNGEWRWILTRGDIIKNAEGRPVRWIGTNLDITESERVKVALQLKNEEYEVVNEELRATTEELQAQNEELRLAGNELRESEERFLKIFKENPYPVMIIDICNGCFFDVNEEMLRNVEYSREELIGQSAVQLGIISPETELKTRKLVAEHGQYSDFEASITTKSGKTRFGLVTGRIFEINKHAYLIQTIVDITERKLAEESLRASEEKYKEFYESIKDGVVFINMNGDITGSNSAFQNMTGYMNAELTLLNFRDITPKKWLVVEEDIVSKQLNEKGYTEPYEKEYQRKDGSNFPVEISVFYLKNKENEPYGMWAIVRNIADRKIIEESLAETQARLKFALEVSGLGEWELNLKTNTVKRNERWAEMLGYSLDEIDDSFERGIDLQHPDDREIVRRAVKDYHDGRSDSFKINYRMRTKSGHYKWIQDCGKTYERDENGKPIRLCGTHADIDDQKQAEERLLSQRRFYEQILEQSLAGYWDWDIPTGNEYLSPTFKKMFGYEDNEIENKADSWQKLIFTEDLPSVYEKFNLHIESKGQIPFCIEVRYHHKDGSTIWVICTGKVIEWDDDGRAKRMIGCHIDITERKRAEEALLEREQYFSELIRKYPLPMVVTDSNQDVEFYNDKFTETFGYVKEDVATLEQWMLEAYPDLAYRTKVKKSWMDAVEKALREKSEMDVQVWDIATKDKQIRTCEFYMKALGKKNLILVNDITNRIVSENMMVMSRLLCKDFIPIDNPSGGRHKEYSIQS